MNRHAVEVLREVAPRVEALSPGAGGAEAVSALLDLAALRKSTRPLELAAKHAQAALDQPVLLDADPAAWTEAAAAGWVRSAAGPYRALLDAATRRLSRSASAVPARVAAWYVTADRRHHDRIVEDLPRTITDASSALAWLAASWLRGDCDRFEESARWLREHPASGVEAHRLVDLWDDRPAPSWDAALREGTDAARLRLAARLAAPPLHLRILWWHEAELGYGPVAEAMTFPWPGLRVRLARRQEAAQVRFYAHLGEGDEEELDDVAVVTSWLESLLAGVDRRPFLG